MSTVIVKFFHKDRDSKVQLFLKSVSSVRIRESLEIPIHSDAFKDHKELTDMVLRNLKVASSEAYPVVMFGHTTVTRAPLRYNLTALVTERFYDKPEFVVELCVEGDHIQFNVTNPHTRETFITLNATPKA